jgi:hypothetical protein
MNTLRRVVVWSWLIAVAGAQAVSADPIRLTGGTLVATRVFEVAPLSLVGTRGFWLDAGLRPDEGRFDVLNCSQEFDCAPGSSVSLDISFSSAAITPDSVMTVDGITYRNVGGLGDPEASVVFDIAGTVTLPQLAGPAVVAAPFVVTEARALLPFPLPSVPIVGGGTAFLHLVPRGGVGPDRVRPGWLLQQARYEFAAAEPVPEPATWLLVGAGALGLLGRRRRRPTSA